MIHRLCAYAAGASMLLAGGAHADSSQTSAVVYGQFAAMSGTTAVGANEADLDVSFSELLDHLDMAGMFAMRNESDQWAVTFNTAFTGLEGDVTDDNGTFYDIDMTQVLFELAGSWRFNERYEAFGGARYQSVSGEVSATALSGAQNAAFSIETWVDPFVGARATWPLGDAWTFIASVDVGGFGIGSDLTWSALAVFDWRVSRSVGVVLGYRALDTDYEDGSGDSRFKLDALIAGPLLGVRFRFGP